MKPMSPAKTIIENCAIATTDANDTEYAKGHLVLDGDTITSVGEGPAPDIEGATRIDAEGCLATAGLVNAHNHLYQWATQGLAQESTLFEWLVELYPLWARLDADVVGDAAKAGLGWLALSGCTTASDHHYVVPRNGGDVFAAEIEAARAVGVRFDPCRGSMDRGRSAGGLPPDEVVEDRDTILAATADLIDRYHDPAPNSMLRIAVAPCSPFSVSADLMTEAAELARSKGVRLHTHLAETADEEEHCREQFGCDPVEYADKLGWLGPDVWLAHTVHLSERAIARIATTGTGTAHCPSSNGRLGAGIAPVADLLAAGAAVGLGVDGPASSEATSLAGELRQALLYARLKGGPKALSPRVALRLGTIGGAQCLGRDHEIGSLEPGKLADIALWDLTGVGHSAIADPVAALVLGGPPRLRNLLVGGRAIVEDGELRTIPHDEVADAGRRARDRIQGRARR